MHRYLVFNVLVVARSFSLAVSDAQVRNSGRQVRCWSIAARIPVATLGHDVRAMASSCRATSTVHVSVTGNGL